MIRRQARLRREYMYRKALEEQQRVTHARKQHVRHALQTGQALPSDVRADAISLFEAGKWDDGGPSQAMRSGAVSGGGASLDDSRTLSHADDEYRWAGVRDPKIVITTSRQPSSRLKKFAKELKLVLPNSQRLNRGSYEMRQLLQAARANHVTDFIKLSEHRGEASTLTICHLPHGPTARFTLLDVVMRHDIPHLAPMSEQYPHLVFHNLSTRLGARVRDILKYLFPVPHAHSRRVLSFVCVDDHILFRHHVLVSAADATEHSATAPSSDAKSITRRSHSRQQLSEVGPRFTLRLYEIRLGTPDEAAIGQIEWVLKPYMNTARKRLHLCEREPWMSASSSEEEGDGGDEEVS